MLRMLSSQDDEIADVKRKEAATMGCGAQQLG
jgi:hypothetical protein